MHLVKDGIKNKTIQEPNSSDEGPNKESRARYFI